MDTGTMAGLRECTDGSIAGTMTFPEVVQRLRALGAESYRADLYRREKTYYLPDGDSCIAPMAVPETPDLTAAAVPAALSAEGVRAALDAVQRQEIDYVTFLRRIMAAGTVAYTVHVGGRQAIYTGRRGDAYVERFPPAL